MTDRLIALRSALAVVEAASEGSALKDARLWCALEGYEFIDYPCDTNGNKKYSDGYVKYRDPQGNMEWQLFKSFPRYTRSLDAAVPGENIVSTDEVWQNAERRWTATARDAYGKLWKAEATTEALARRAAGLRGLIAQEEANDTNG